MISTTNKILLSLSAVVLVCAISLFALRQEPVEPAFGSVVVGNEYNATNTASMSAGMVQLRTGQSTLGSVVVASSSGTTFQVWNATSTLDIASTTPVNFVAAPANGTYTFDATFERGIILELPTGYNGAYTVTWR